MVSPELEHIQGNILRGYNFPRAVHLFFRVDDEAGAHEFLGEIVRHVTTGQTWERKRRPALTLNVALTYRGLQRLGVGKDVLNALPPEFSEPITERAPRVLSDVLGKWEDHFKNGNIDVLVMVSAREPEAESPSMRVALERWAKESGAGVAPRGLRTALRPARPATAELHAAVRCLAAIAVKQGLGFLHAEAVETIAGQREHFGWADGFGQPAIEGTESNRPGQGIPNDSDLGWRAIKLGEFIHGYVDEDGQLTSGPAAALLRNGSFMVYRKYEQHVERFNRLLDAEAKRFRAWIGRDLTDAQARELLAAKLAGRWRDGVSLELETERSDEACRDLVSKSAERPVDNDFRYADDRNGFRCPVGAHIRRTNPRDAEGRGGQMAARHRIIRRSMPYGRPGREPRGLSFICFAADIARQFETVHSQWCEDGNAFGLGDDRDWLLNDGRGTRKATIQGVPPFFANARKPLVSVRGCAYLLMPSIDALQAIAEGAW